MVFQLYNDRNLPLASVRVPKHGNEFPQIKSLTTAKFITILEQQQR